MRQRNDTRKHTEKSAEGHLERISEVKSADVASAHK